MRCPHQWQDGCPSSSARLFFLNSAVFRVVGFVLRWGVRLFGGMVFFASARCRACCRFCLSCVAWPPRSVGLCFVFNVSHVSD